MNFIKKFLKELSVLGIIFFLVYLGSCSKKNKIEKTIRLAVWGTPEELKIITDTIDKWKKESHPEFDVKIEHIPWDSYLSKIETEIAGNSAPDVIACESTFFPKFIKVNALESLNKYIEKDKNFNLNKYYKTIVDNFTYKGKLYVLPRDVSAVACIYYNKQLFDEAGIPYPDDNWDYKEFIDIAKKLTKRDKNGRVLVYGFFSGFWDNFIYNNGGRFVDSIKNPTKSKISSPKFKEGLQFYYDLAYKYKVSPDFKALSKLDSGETQLFEMGRLAMLGSGIWLVPVFRKASATGRLDWDIAMWPQVKKGKGISVEIGGTGYAILRTSKNKKLAWELLKVLSGDEGEKILAKTGLALPANRIIAESEYWMLDKNSYPKNKSIVIKALKYNNVYYPFLASWPEILNKYIQPEVDKLMNKLEPIDEAIKNMDESLNNALKLEE